MKGNNKKKILIGSIVLIVFALLIIICYNKLKWKTVSIENIGSVKVPGEWCFSQNDRYVYFTDIPMKKGEAYNIYMVGVVSKPGFEWKHIPMSELFEDVKVEILNSFINSEGFSNSVLFGETEVAVDGKKTHKFELKLWESNEQYLRLLVWDDSLDEELVRKIGKSFKMELGV